MARSSTTTSVWRSQGGDNSRTAYAGSMLMVADFYFSATGAANTKVQKSSTDTNNVILPVGAIITEIQANAAGTGGTNPTFDMGFTLYTSGTTNAVTLLNEADADRSEEHTSELQSH